MLCKEGEYGATAFLIESGSFEIKIQAQTDVHLGTKSAGGLWGWLGRLTTGPRRRRINVGRASWMLVGKRSAQMK